MYILCTKMPGKGRRIGGYRCYFACRCAILVTISNFISILQGAGSCQHVMLINSNVYIVIAPYAIKFPGYIWIGVPALVVILHHFRIPLAHTITDAFCIVTATTTYLYRYL